MSNFIKKNINHHDEGLEDNEIEINLDLVRYTFIRLNEDTKNFELVYHFNSFVYNDINIKHDEIIEVFDTKEEAQERRRQIKI